MQCAEIKHLCRLAGSWVVLLVLTVLVCLGAPVLLVVLGGPMLGHTLGVAHEMAKL